MRMSQGVEWAVHACAVLAALGKGRALSAAALAEFHGIPAPYMAKQMQLLSRAGIVSTSRGKAGGYSLARAPGQINLWQIARAIEGPAPLFRCSEIRQRGPCAARRDECRRPCDIAAAFARAETAWRSELERIMLSDIAAAALIGKSPESLQAAGQWLTGRATQPGAPHT
jgi:Rrf2 family protein